MLKKANIQQLEPKIPRTLLDFLKYPVHLKLGEFLARGEKLVADDGRCEMWIDEKSGELVVKNSESRVNVLGKCFDVVCVHRFHIVFYDMLNSRVTHAHSIYDTNRSFRFTGEWEKLTWKLDML